MKKFVIVSIIFVLAIACVATLSACDLFGGKDEPQTETPPIEPVSEATPAFFSTEKIVYNTNYSNPDSPQEKGYFVYDAINLHAITFDPAFVKINSTYPAYIDVYYKANKEVSYAYRSDIQLFTFTKPGPYRVEITAKRADGQGQYTADFSVPVVVGDRPTSVNFTFSDGVNSLEHVESGKSITITANVLTDGKPCTSTDFVPYWTNADEPSLTLTESYGNSLALRTDSKIFRTSLNVVNNPNDYKLTWYCDYEISPNLLTTAENPDGFDFTLPETFNADKVANLTALQKPYEGNPSATVYFRGGDTKVITTASSLVEDGARLYMYIKYNGENSFRDFGQTFYRYTRNADDRLITSYYENDTKYYFDNTKTSAEVYFVLRARNTDESFSEYIIDDSEATINLTSVTPEELKVTSVEGRRRAVITSTVSLGAYTRTPAYDGYMKTESFDTDVVGDSVDVYICCDMDRDGDLEDEYEYRNGNYYPQYFELETTADAGKAKDYFVTVNNPDNFRPIVDHYVYYSKVGVSETIRRYFVPLREGTVTITLTPRAGGTPYVLTVNVINPTIITELKTDGVDNVYAREIDMDDEVRVEEWHYNTNKEYSPDFGRTYRSKDPDESLVYYYDGAVRAPSFFTFTDMPLTGYNINVRLMKDGRTIADANANGIYIVPNVSFSFDGGTTTYSLYDYSQTKYFSRPLTVGYKRLILEGNMPELNLIVPDLSVITNETLLLTGEASEDRNLTSSIGSSSMLLKYAYYHEGQRFEAEIGYIYFTEQES